ncbi:MAG TPA: sigma-70 family RNA polymerase sigma factor [Polyangia bacterium]|nr:sigma-70 family RNA polymerase sigma factor [Polyangia bacterium]
MRTITHRLDSVHGRGQIEQLPPEAVIELLHHGMRRGFRIACAMVGDRAEAEDCVQEALARVIEQQARLRDPRALEGWFHRVLSNLCLRVLRRRRLRGLVHRLWEEHREPSVAPDEILARRQALGSLQAALDELPAMQKAALALRYGGGLSVADIASALGVRANTAKTHLCRGLERLRRNLEGTRDGRL